jgi:hypothetical protein
VNTETLVNRSIDRRINRSEPGAASSARLPEAYGDDTLVLMVRDPTGAHAYWEMSVARVNEAIASLGGGKALLQLFGVPSGYLLAEQEVWAERGSYDVALPEADHSYVAELAIFHHYRRVVLARSNVVDAPPNMPRPAAGPVFVSRPEQRRAFELGLTLDSRRGESSAPLPRNAGGASIAQASEAPLSEVGSTRRLAGPT